MKHIQIETRLNTHVFKSCLKPANDGTAVIVHRRAFYKRVAATANAQLQIGIITKSTVAENENHTEL